MGQWVGRVIGVDPHTCQDVTEMRYADQIVAGVAFAAVRNVKSPNSHIIWASPDALKQLATLNGHVEYYITQLSRFHWGTVFRPKQNPGLIGILDLQTKELPCSPAAAAGGDLASSPVTSVWLVKLRMGRVWQPPEPSRVHTSDAQWTLRRLLVGCIDHCKAFGQYSATTHNCCEFSYGLVSRLVALAEAEDTTTETAIPEEGVELRHHFFAKDRTGTFLPPSADELVDYAHAQGFCLLVAKANESIDEEAVRWLNSPDVDWSSWHTVESSFHAFLTRPDSAS